MGKVYNDGLGNPLRTGFYVQRSQGEGPIMGNFPYHNEIVFIDVESKIAIYSNRIRKGFASWDDLTPRPSEFEPITLERIREVIAFRRRDLKDLERLVKNHSSKKKH